VDYPKACQAAIAKGIVVNTIHCGPDAAGVSGKWKDGAVLADGSYMCIDQNRTVAEPPAPQDKRLAELSAALNKTYLAYGRGGKEGAARQVAQDANAASVSAGIVAQRAATRSSAYYTNEAWDLVDALGKGKAKLEEVKKEDLPEEMQKMTLDEQRAHVEAKAKERAKLQQEIQQLSEARKQFVAAEMKKLAAKSGGGSLDEAMIKSLRTQAEAKRFELK